MPRIRLERTGKVDAASSRVLLYGIREFQETRLEAASTRAATQGILAFPGVMKIFYAQIQLKRTTTSLFQLNLWVKEKP